MKNLIDNYKSDNRIIFFSSHIIEMVENVCDEVIIISKGNLIKHIKTFDKTIDLTKTYINATQ